VRVVAWSKTSNNGNKFLSLKVEADTPRQGAGGGSSDEIPF
jgi:uncharacterized protein (DUF736 family)